MVASFGGIFGRTVDFSLNCVKQKKEKKKEEDSVLEWNCGLGESQGRVLEWNCGLVESQGR